jgi:hypothetical protein
MKTHRTQHIIHQEDHLFLRGRFRKIHAGETA